MNQVWHELSSERNIEKTYSIGHLETNATQVLSWSLPTSTTEVWYIACWSAEYTLSTKLSYKLQRNRVMPTTMLSIRDKVHHKEEIYFLPMEVLRRVKSGLL